VDNFIRVLEIDTRYSYIFLIKYKALILDIFKFFKVEVELQLNKMIKQAIPDCGGEYYGQYDSSSTMFGAFC
jgi:hypothetical protein